MNGLKWYEHFRSEQEDVQDERIRLLEDEELAIVGNTLWLTVLLNHFRIVKSPCLEAFLVKCVHFMLRDIDSEILFYIVITALSLNDSGEVLLRRSERSHEYASDVKERHDYHSLDSESNSVLNDIDQPL